MIKEGVSTSQLTKIMCPDIRKTLNLLAKNDKTLQDYEALCIKDSELSFKAMEIGSLKYVGQVRMIPIHGRNPSNTSYGKQQN
jgi:hypothetical protein